MTTTTLRLSFAITTSLALLAACATTSAGARPGDMSAAEHRAHARADERRAEQHQSKYNPGAETPSHARGSFAYSEALYNPTAHHLSKAADLRERANEHEQAARALEAFTGAECGEFPPETRKLCPLLTVVESVENVDGGARLQIASDVPLKAVVDHMRCHHAFGLQQHYEGMDACPLYLGNIEIEPGADGRSVVITSKDPAMVDQIRKRAEAHVGH